MKEWEIRKQLMPQEVKDRRQTVQMSLQTSANAWVANRFWTYIKVRHTQDSYITSLYPVNTGHREIIGQRAWYGGGEKRKRILRFLLRLLGEMSYQDDIPSKRSKDELEPLGACHEGYREKTLTLQQVKVPRQTNKQKSLLCLVMGSGIANTDRSVVVDKYIQTKQRWLKAKIVKSDHSRHYKKGPLPCTGGITITVIIISRRK